MNNFRSYGVLSLQDIAPKNVILCGANGAGKTNILEALSLLSPGRGLRGAKVAEMQNQQAHDPAWTVSCGLSGDFGDIQIGTGRNAINDKRIIRINEETVKSQTVLGEWLSCLWLTPQMDRLFLDDKSQRRRFFDRLVYTFDPAHLGRLTRYENAMRQRMRLLKEGGADPHWLLGIESQMSEAAIAICAARGGFCERLQVAYHSATEEERENFPNANLEINGSIEQSLKSQKALIIEDKFRYDLQSARDKDGASGITTHGPHRSDFIVAYADKNMPASQCSTGEQKALLIGIILAHARLLHEERGAAPLLLLDEIVAHLDEHRRRVLSNVLKGYSAQVWMTGTDPTLFEAFQDHSQFYDVADSSVLPSSFDACSLTSA